MGTDKRTTVTIACDSPSCGTKMMWVQEEVQANQNALPDAAWRLLTFATFDGQVKGFCSKTCLLGFLRDFVPLKSPKELAEIAEAEKQLAAQAAAMTNEGGIVIPGSINPTTTGAVPDATGTP